MRYKHCCKSDADSEWLESFKLGVFAATATSLKPSNCSSKKSPSENLNETFIYNYVEYVQTEQQIYVQVYM